MSTITRSIGTTQSERYLAKLADRTFLNLWSYPNVFTDRGLQVTGIGKELCDLLIVCGDHVLVFSDKTIAWPENKNVELAWNRWFRRAVQKSVAQVRGAMRWIDEFPDRIFLDAECTRPFPLSLPPRNKRRMHGIVVALGAGSACREFFGEGNGSLFIAPDITGDAHTQGGAIVPFCVGDLNPDGPFIHVLDDATLDIALTELDTITDFTQHLNKKENLIRSGKLIAASGEEDLVAYYMTHMNYETNEHDFTSPEGHPLGQLDKIIIGSEFYSEMQNNPQYLAKKDADKVSYAWDGLIETFTKHMLAGTTVTLDGEKLQLSDYEQSIRHMALVPRHLRRPFGRGFLDALKRGRSANPFTRGIVLRPGERYSDTGYFFLTLALPDFPLEGGYVQYRRTRRNMLEAYALTFLQRCRHLKRVVGIATEPPRKSGAPSGSSEDLVFAEAPRWTDELIEELKERQKFFNIGEVGRLNVYELQDPEFPDLGRSNETTSMGRQLNRRERRAKKARSRR